MLTMRVLYRWVSSALPNQKRILFYIKEIHMKESKPVYIISDYEQILGMVWETELGRVVTCEGKWNIKNNLSIRDIETDEEIKNIDLRNVLMEILPSK
jgi:hypothetical protein